MKHAQLWPVGVGVAVVVLCSAAPGQQPARPPALPPIAPNLARLDQTLNGLDGPGFAVVASDEAGLLAAACDQGTIRCWSRDVMLGVRAGDNTPLVLKGHLGPVTALAWSGGPVLASAGADQKVILWNMPEGKPAYTLPAETTVRSLAMSPGGDNPRAIGKFLAGGGENGVVQLWDVVTGKPASKLTGHGDYVLSLAFSADGKLLASGSYNNQVILWEMDREEKTPGRLGKKLLDVMARAPAAANTDPGPPNTVLALAFSPDRALLAAGGTDGQVHLFNPADGKYVRSLAGHTSSVTGLQFHPSGTVLVSSSKDRTVRLWNPANGQLVKALEGHTAWVEGVTLLAQGTRLASVGADHSVRLWDLTDPAKK
jgi:WD40 repeat protein